MRCYFSQLKTLNILNLFIIIFVISVLLAFISGLESWPQFLAYIIPTEIAGIAVYIHFISWQKVFYKINKLHSKPSITRQFIVYLNDDGALVSWNIRTTLSTAILTLVIGFTTLFYFIVFYI